MVLICVHFNHLESFGSNFTCFLLSFALAYFPVFPASFTSDIYSFCLFVFLPLFPCPLHSCFPCSSILSFIFGNLRMHFFGSGTGWDATAISQSWTWWIPQEFSWGRSFPLFIHMATSLLYSRRTNVINAMSFLMQWAFFFGHSEDVSASEFSSCTKAMLRSSGSTKRESGRSSNFPGSWRIVWKLSTNLC